MANGTDMSNEQRDVQVTGDVQTLHDPPKHLSICAWCDWSALWDTEGEANTSAELHAIRHGEQGPVGH